LNGHSVRLGIVDIPNQLKQVGAFKSLPEAVLTALLPHCSVRSAPRDGVFFMPGDPPAAYLLVRGRVSILVRPTPETEIELGGRGPGELFGELSLLLGRQVNEARSTAAAVAIRIERSGFRAILGADTPAMQLVADLVARQMAALEARLREIAVGSLRDHLSLVIERLAADAHVHDADGDHLPREITRAQLARVVGASREAVSRALSRLQREGRVILRGRRIIIPPNESAALRAG
jgi:CRP/FNR family cyclic AMP-dependent transcriptional regulator